MRINIGSGLFPKEGHLNIDMHTEADVQGDFMEMEFSDVEYIEMSHVLEHLSWRKVPAALTLVYGWLQPRGIIRIEVPDMDTLMSWGTTYNLWQLAIFGSQDHDGEFHKAGFTKQSLSELVSKAGFRAAHGRSFLSEHPGRVGYPCLEVTAHKP